MMNHRDRSRTADAGSPPLRTLAVAVLAIAVVLAAGCSPSAPDTTERVGDPVEPAPHDLSTPESAVRSYLDWVSFSYRMANSEIPLATMTAAESVRVDAYIQLNRMEGKGLDQSLESFEVRTASAEATSAVVAASELWRYRYFSLDTLRYLSEAANASYETTYTVVLEADGWRVDRVEATLTGGSE